MVKKSASAPENRQDATSPVDLSLSSTSLPLKHLCVQLVLLHSWPDTFPASKNPEGQSVTVLAKTVLTAFVFSQASVPS